MNNNIYVRNKTSIKTISLTRIILLLPLIIYGFYKNGIYLYKNGYINIINMFKPLLLILIGALIGIVTNILYEKLINRSRCNLDEIIFSSFHLEYGIVLACLSSINTNILIFALATLVIFTLSKFLNNRINTIAIASIVIYAISLINGEYIFENSYELSKKFSLNFLDYLIGRGSGGIASTHILLLLVAIVGMHLTSNNKTEITTSSVLAYTIPTIILGIFTHSDILRTLFSYNYFFIFTYVATDSVTSCYTANGKIIYGIFIGLTTFGLSMLNPVLAPFVSIAIFSILNNLIDRKGNMLKKS